MLMTKVNNKIYEPESYDKAINDPIYGWRWREIIEEDLQNLENYQTWKYAEILPRTKVIELK